MRPGSANRFHATTFAQFTFMKTNDFTNDQTTRRSFIRLVSFLYNSLILFSIYCFHLISFYLGGNIRIFFSPLVFLLFSLQFDPGENVSFETIIITRRVHYILTESATVSLKIKKY